MIAEACGVSKALMYHYYNSKDDVLFDLLADHLNHLIAAVEAASEAAGDGKERLFAICTALLEAYRGADAEHNASALKDVLDNKPGAYRDVAVMNAAAALVVAGATKTLQEGAELARKSLSSGAARARLDKLVAVSNA